MLGLLALAAPALTACGQSGDAAAPPPRVATATPAATFAPLVALDSRERSLPISSDYFLRNSGLEWGGGPCPFDVDLAAGPASRPLIGTPVPALEPRRLGHEPAYRLRPRARDCEHGRPQVFSSAQRTRPFDGADRPPDLYRDEGFTLDILTDYQAGERRIAPDGSLAGVPAYFARERVAVAGARGLRLSYWLLFGRGRAVRPDGQAVTHEGDWERVDVLARQRRPRAPFEPIAVRYRAGDRFVELPWSGVERAGPGGTHPVVHLERGSHTPGPQPTRAAGEEPLHWKTWRRLRDVRREPWFGYGGGWGAIGDSDAETGPLGPSPFELEADAPIAPDWTSQQPATEPPPPPEPPAAARDVQSQLPPGTAAVVLDETIARAQVEQQAKGLRAAGGGALGAHRRALSQLILREVLEQELTRRGFGVDPARVRAELRRTRRAAAERAARPLPRRALSALRLEARVRALRASIHKIVAGEDRRHPELEIARFERELLPRWRKGTICRAGAAVPECGS